VQAVHFKGCVEKLAPATRWMYDEISRLAPPFVEDSPFTERLTAIKGWLMETEVGEKMQKLLGW
jgi:hypothetical protein